MPDNDLATSTLKPTGEVLLTPTLRDTAHSGYRIELEGFFQFDLNGRQFDAVYQTGPDGAFTQPHTYLQWTPQSPILESADVARHRYVFRIPAEWERDGQSVGVRVDVDRFVNEFLISPSEVRNALSGEMQMTLRQIPPAPVFPWQALGYSALPALLLLGGVGVVIRRRLALGGLAYDLQLQIGQLQQKFRIARAALGHRSGARLALHERLDAVQAGAFALVRQIQNLRNAQALTRRPQLEAEIKALQKQLAALPDNAARREGEAALVEKRKTLALLDELKQSEACCVLRLTKMEAVLETTCLSLRGIQAHAAPVPDNETLCRQLDAEVSAIYEVAREFPACETLQTQGLTLRR